MPQATTIKTNFSAGELSPLMAGRVDVSKYANGAETFENFIARIHGPAQRRSGTYYVSELKSSANRARLLLFEYSTTQAYVIEFGPSYVRFYRNHARVETVPGTAYEVATPYGAGDLADLKFTQSADVLYICHPSYMPRKLARLSDTSWTLTAIDPQDGPYLPKDSSGKTITVTGSGPYTLTASAALFAATDVGRDISIPQGSGHAWFRVTAFTSSTVVTATLKAGTAPSSAATAFRLGAWSDTTGYPSCATFYQDRLTFAGSKSNPQTVWGSFSGDYENFADQKLTDATVAASNAYIFTVNDENVNAARWLSPEDVLLIGTQGGEHKLAAASQTEALSATNVQVRRQSTHGSQKSVSAIRADNAVLFLQRAGRKVREVKYDFQTDKYLALDLTELAEHVTRGGVSEMCFQEEPASVVWMVRGDGQLIGCTYNRAQDVVAWHRHVIGGQYYGGPAVVESVACIPTPDGTADEIWLIVKRTIGGAVKRYVEYMKPLFDPAAQAAEEAYFVDCGLQSALTTPAATLTPSALDGEGVTFAADAAAFAAGDVGKHIRINGGLALVTAYTDSQHVTGQYLRPARSTEPQASGAWSLQAVTTTFTGLDHLEGETVSVLGDGAVFSDAVVSGGAVTLDAPGASYAAIGLPCPATLVPMRVEGGAASGTAQGMLKRIHKAVFRFLASAGAQYGEAVGKLHELEARAPSDLLGVAPDLFTGDRVVEPPQGWDRDGQMVLYCAKPLPCVVVAIIYQLQTSA
jgi:hypothetical protein